MADRLEKYTLGKLAERVESGGDSDAQKAEPILIAKSMIELTGQLEILQKQLQATGKDIREIIGYRVESLTKSIDNLRDVFVKYSDSGDKYGLAMKRLTYALVFFTAVQAIGVLISVFNH